MIVLCNDSFQNIKYFTNKIKLKSHRQNYEKYEDGLTINTEHVVDESALRTVQVFDK
jgi:hypothetical protein